MSESKAHQVEIREVDGQTLRKLVDYIYTAEIEVTEDNVQVSVCVRVNWWQGREWVKKHFPVFIQFFFLVSRRLRPCFQHWCHISAAVTELAGRWHNSHCVGFLWVVSLSAFPLLCWRLQLFLPGNKHLVHHFAIWIIKWSSAAAPSQKNLGSH